MEQRDNTEARLAIVVVNFASHDLVIANLTSLDWKSLGAKVVVVDSFSSEVERSAISRAAREHGWEFLGTSSNVGFGAGMNRGVERAIHLGATQVVLLNPDVSLTAHSLNELWETVRREPMAICSPVLVRPDGRIWFAGGQIDLRTGRTRSRASHDPQANDGWLSGACLAMNSELWEQLGGFDERFFMYWEDVDLTRRCLGQGGSLYVLADVEAVHEVGATQGSARKSNLYAYYVCRNRLLFSSIHLTVRERLLWIWHTPVESWRIAMRDGRRSALRRPGYLVAALRGSIAGFALVIRSLFSRPRVPTVSSARVPDE